MTARVPTPHPPEVRPSRFSHLVVKTADLAPMAAWYKTVLGARPMFENERVCFLTYDEEHHRIMIGNNPNATPRDPKASGVVHWAYAFETLADLVDAYSRLKAEGIVPHSCINHGFTTSLYYLDPDKNQVLIFGGVRYRSDGNHRYLNGTSVYDFESGATTNITESAPVSFIDVEDDHNVDRPPLPTLPRSRGDPPGPARRRGTRWWCVPAWIPRPVAGR